jgi:two-component system, NarL family, invasion response regulator UvrY
MIGILIADDHAIVRAGLKQLVIDHPQMAVIAEANTGSEALELIRKLSPNVVLLDISMPGRGGLEVLSDIKKEFPRLPVLILSVHPEEQYAIRALKAGASGYITKDTAPEELITAILKVSNGGRYITRSLAEQFLHLFDAENEPPHTTLSNREFQVFSLLAGGKTATEIANELSLSVKTLSTYRSRILEKLRLKNNAQLIHYAAQHHLLP